MKIIVKMKFGSHLYGTDTPESDTDYKGIFLPTLKDLMLGNIPKSYSTCTKKGNEERNTSDDIDEEIYSLHYFMKLACEGQTVALDMLHAHDDVIVNGGKIWDIIVENRRIFYTKNLKAFVGYARRQAAKYGIKGSRLAAAKKIINIISDVDPEDRLYQIWNLLPEEKHLYHINDSPNGCSQYQVCGKILQATQKVGYTKNILENFITQYGKRARMAERNEGVDWKAMSHAMRAAYQVEELLKSDTITMPRPEAQYLLQVKQGCYNFIDVQKNLENIMNEVELLSEKSKLPNKVNKKLADGLLIKIIEENILSQ